MSQQLSFSPTNTEWRPYPPKILDKLGITPNKLYFNESTAVGVLAAKSSGKYAEYAVSKAGLDYLHSAVTEGRISEGWVVLHTGWSIEAKKPIGEVMALLEGVAPRTDGAFGAYFWFNNNLTLNVRQSNGGGQMYRETEIPF
jgi:hypothetical protein